MVRTKAFHRHVDEFHDGNMSLEFAEAVWARCKAIAIVLQKISSLSEQRAFVRKLNNEPAVTNLRGLGAEECNWDFEGRVTAEENSSSGLRGSSREAQHVCEDGGEAASLTSVQVVELAREGVEAKRKNTTLSKRDMGIEAKSVDTGAAKITIREQVAGAERRIAPLKTYLADAQLALW